MVEWGELSFKVVRMEKAGQEVLARAGNGASRIRCSGVALADSGDRAAARSARDLLHETRLNLPAIRANAPWHLCARRGDSSGPLIGNRVRDIFSERTVREDANT
jgi:hypothetical protein